MLLAESSTAFYSRGMEKPTDAEIKVLREAATERVKATSLRAASREIGMSPSGLQKFINGAEPYGPTIRRLRAWYGDEAAQREQAEATAQFLGFLPPQRRASAEPILRALMAGPGREKLVLDRSLTQFISGAERPRIAKALVQLAQRHRPSPPRQANLAVEDVAILGALVDLLDAELPLDAEFQLNGRRLRRKVLVDAVRKYIDQLIR